MGGDVVGKLAIPVIREGNGGFRAYLMGKTEHLEGASRPARASRIGSERSAITAKSWTRTSTRRFKSDPAAVDRLFHELARERLASWIDLAETRLSGSGSQMLRDRRQ